MRVSIHACSYLPASRSAHACAYLCVFYLCAPRSAQARVDSYVFYISGPAFRLSSSLYLIRIRSNNFWSNAYAVVFLGLQQNSKYSVLSVGWLIVGRSVCCNDVCVYIFTGRSILAVLYPVSHIRFRIVAHFLFVIVKKRFVTS